MKITRMLLALILLSLFFMVFPQTDLWVSQHFYSATSEQFLLQNSQMVDGIRAAVVDALWALNIGLILVLVVKSIFPRCVQWIQAKTALYVLLCFLVAPSLVVNVLLKDHWGRPRPTQIESFGGDKIFQPAWKISQQCDHNCAFVCGDCAMVFTLFAFVPLVKRKKLLACAVTTAGLSMGALRLAAGGHFLSDVVLSGLLVYVLVLLIYTLFLRVSELRIEQFFVRK